MRLADAMLAARRRGDRKDALALAREACTEELAAASLAFDRGVSAATRIILLRSASNLARDAKLWDLGIDLVVRALATADLREYRADLLHILDTLRTYEHLQISGVELARTDVQLVVSGPDAAPGFARADEVTRRVDQIKSFMVRDTMRRQGLAFDAPAPRAQKFRESVTPYLSLPRAASYAVTVRFGVHEQVEMALNDEGSSHVVAVEDSLDDLIEAAQAYADGGAEAVRSVIPDELYARHAAGLLRQLAPDSARIATVGLTVVRDGQARAVALPERKSTSRPPEALPKPLRGEALPPKVFEIVGLLLKGSAMPDARPSASVVPEDGRAIPFVYDEAEHGDVVHSYWKQRVRVDLIRVGKSRMLLKDIAPA